MIVKQSAFVFAAWLFSSAALAEGWQTAVHAIHGYSDYDVSGCTGDCVVVPQRPSNDSHFIGVGIGGEKRFGGIGVGATARIYDATETDAFFNFIDAYVRVSFAAGSFRPYVGVGISKQDYDARMATKDGPNIDDRSTAPLYVLGLEQETRWGTWFVELLRTDDELSVRSTRSISGSNVPVAAEFDMKRTTALIGLSFTLGK